MENFNISKQALRETYIILNKLNLYDRIPKEFQNYIEENQDENYESSFNQQMPLFEQVKIEETKKLLTYLFIKYINTNSEDATNLKNIVIDFMKRQKKTHAC